MRSAGCYDRERSRVFADYQALCSDLRNRSRELCADYPWTLNTPHEDLWALSESLKGVTAACDDWCVHTKQLTAELSALRTDYARLRDTTNALLKQADETRERLKEENALLRKSLAQANAKINKGEHS